MLARHFLRRQRRSQAFRDVARMTWFIEQFACGANSNAWAGLPRSLVVNSTDQRGDDGGRRPALPRADVGTGRSSLFRVNGLLNFFLQPGVVCKR